MPRTTASRVPEEPKKPEKRELTLKDRVAILVTAALTLVTPLLVWWGFAHWPSLVLVLLFLTLVSLIVFIIYLIPISIHWATSGDWEWSWWYYNF